ncbi:MAG: hypothetical protein EBR09_06210 [Proteobacteria bacterium]|nr:hypothetical protein [Pseudomonadota bacterium]
MKLFKAESFENHTCRKHRTWIFFSFILASGFPFHSHARTAESDALNIEDRTEKQAPPPSRWTSELFLEPKTIKPTLKTLKLRIEAEKRKPEISEPVVLRLKTQEIRPLLAQLSSDAAFRKYTQSPKHNFALMKQLEKRLEKKDSPTEGEESKKPTVALLTLAESDLSWIDLTKLSNALAFPSVEPYLPIAQIKELKNGESATLDRWKSHFGSRFSEIKATAEKWLEANSGAIQMPLKTLLPPHMRGLVGRYSPFRGRNCFATALQFANPKIIQAKNINLVREPGHSLALINHDEFSHALWLGYDELAAAQLGAGLQFGDVIAITDGQEGNAFTSFKHAAVHMAADVYLHKPSKSASSPIEFVRWHELVQTWTPLVKQLEIRYFRPRPGEQIQERGLGVAIEKIKWNR